jgi:Na+-driven multidrug efflux pump
MFYLNSFQKMAAGMLSSLTCIAVQILCNVWLITNLNMGTLGAGLSLSAAVIYQSIFLYLAIHFDPVVKEANYWPTFDEEQW